MGKPRDKLSDVRFHCVECDLRFDAEPVRVDDAPEDAWHPWRYAGECPRCGAECAQERQQRHLLKMWAKATGPRTAEGKAASAGNLVGHPTPEEAQRTRFNALKHGMTARVASYWPARPGRYAQCTGCEYLDSICWKQTACLKRAELFLRHHVAFETKNPELLSELNADLHSNLRALLEDMLRTVIIDTPRLRKPVHWFSPEGAVHLARYVDPETGEEKLIEELSAHPLIKPITDLVHKLNLGLSDQAMTPRAQEDADVVRGHLEVDKSRAESEQVLRERSVAALENLSHLIQRSRDAASRDPILIEHREQFGDDADGP